MIVEALLHCPGIGPARLAQLHELEIRTWSDAVQHADRIPSSYRDAVVEECHRCLAALDNRDVAYLVERLAPQDKGRVVSEFFDRMSFFDIETTGLEHDSRITVIACWHRGRLHTFVEHENLDDFLLLLDEVTLLASFNGGSFDVPRILDSFHIPALPCPHLDLRWPCYHGGLRGTLKDIARRAGVSRPNDLQDADGALAVHLWNRWMMQEDRAARDQLVRYCAADVLLLVMVASGVAGRSRRTPDELWAHLPGTTDAVELPATSPASPPRPHNAFGKAGPSRLRAHRARAAG